MAWYVIILNLGNKSATININQYYDMGQKVEIITASMQSKYSDG